MVARGDHLPEFDLQSSLLSLPHVFRTTVDAVPAQVPYLSAPPDKVRRWAELLGERQRPRLGIVWAGSPTNRNDLNRSAALADFAALQALGVELISLQKEARAEDAATMAEMGVRHFGTELHDFAETAGLIANVDAVVSVDTSVAHLAGAMGRDVWVLLPFYGLDWRWLLDRNDSPWYPTARLVRQGRGESWSAAIAGAADQLRARVAA